MASPAYVIQQKMKTDTVNFSLNNYSIFVSQEPATPDRSITIYDYSGMNKIVILNGGDSSEDIERPAVQFRVRAERGGYNVAMSMIEQIQDYMLNGLFETQDSTYCYKGAIQSTSCTSLGNDDSERPILVLNFYIYKTKL